VRLFRVPALGLLTLIVACGDDSPSDAGLTVPDSGVTPRDAAVPPRDLGTRDLGTRDLGTPDLGVADTGIHPDAMVVDAGPDDTGVEPDAGIEDTGPVDTGPSCNDGIRNEDEHWVDCGGWCNNLCPACPNTGNLLRNPSFETASVVVLDQGVMPDEWIVVQPSPDTYSNDGSFGLPPNGYGNFTGVVAQDGVRWVAGWNGLPETFGQVLTSSLTPGARYRLEGYMHPAIRGDLTSDGTYVVSLEDGAGQQASVLGRFGYTNTVAWQHRMFEFVAPPDAGKLPLMHFVPTSTIGSSYPGLDNLLLVQTSSCTN
jgi:hypothetical protein